MYFAIMNEFVWRKKKKIKFCIYNIYKFAYDEMDFLLLKRLTMKTQNS